jgi:hypothetical protein
MKSLGVIRNVIAVDNDPMVYLTLQNDVGFYSRIITRDEYLQLLQAADGAVPFDLVGYDLRVEYSLVELPPIKPQS